VEWWKLKLGCQRETQWPGEAHGCGGGYKRWPAKVAHVEALVAKREWSRGRLQAALGASSSMMRAQWSCAREGGGWGDRRWRVSESTSGGILRTRAVRPSCIPARAAGGRGRVEEDAWPGHQVDMGFWHVGPTWHKFQNKNKFKMVSSAAKIGIGW
jgi:hypothetical protein